MMFPRLMSNYILVRKSSLLLGSLVAVGLIACHFYKYHRAEMMEDFDQFTDDVADVAKKGNRKVKEVVDDVKS